jgi:hypothetical protein
VRTLRPALIAVVLLAVAPAAASATRVLYVGDSLGVGTTPYLRGLLPGTPIRADNRVGRPTPEALGVLAKLIRPSDTVIVFDSGTNDSPAATAAYAARLRQVRQIAGKRCVVLATINRPKVGGVGPAGLNKVIAGLAYADPDLQVADWASVVNRRILGPDGVHATGQGYALRAQLVGQAIQECVLAAAALKTAPRPAPEPEPTTTAQPRAKPKPKKPALPPFGPSVRRYWHPTVHDLAVLARTLGRGTMLLARRAGDAVG